MKINKGKHRNFQRLRRQAEKRLRDRDSVLAYMPSKDKNELIHELEVYQIELEMQNEELRRTQRKLIESRDQYHELYEFAPLGYFTLDEKATIWQVNLTGADLLGLPKSKLSNTKFSRFISPDFQDDFYFHCQRIFEIGTKQTSVLKLLT